MMTATKEKNIKSKVRARWPLNELKIWKILFISKIWELKQS
jgi:hypothetical protein